MEGGRRTRSSTHGSPVPFTKVVESVKRKAPTATPRRTKKNKSESVDDVDGALVSTAKNKEDTVPKIVNENSTEQVEKVDETEVSSH